ncbi:MAG: hypothetical protein WCP68_22340 [Enhydrobacter sp.]
MVLSLIHRGRVDMYYPCEREDGYFRWGTMEGASGDYFAIRMKSDLNVAISLPGLA